MNKIKTVLLLLIFVIIIILNFNITYSDSIDLLNYKDKSNNTVYFFSKDFQPGKPHFFLVYSKDKEFLNNIIVDYAKFYFMKLFENNNWYLCFYSINVPYKNLNLELKIIEKSSKKILFKYIYILPEKEKKDEKKYSTTIKATQNMVNLSQQKDISILEREFFQKIYTKVIEEKYFILPFSYPLEKNIITSPFGLARAYKDSNGNIYKISYHYGVDFKGKEGDKVYATNNGYIRFAGFKDIRGNCIVIDHGYGIYSTYFHLSKIVVNDGSFVKKGTYIGEVGATGSATGPHLHYELRINNVLVDGVEIIKIYNQILKIIKNFDTEKMILNLKSYTEVENILEEEIINEENNDN
ncbi:MAG: M23 family metallopeptidase [Spirochaetes bacterium]|nr:M23 family metallopeptidase [Spirochaetota bacterium]